MFKDVNKYLKEEEEKTAKENANRDVINLTQSIL